MLYHLANQAGVFRYEDWRAKEKINFTNLEFLFFLSPHEGRWATSSEFVSSSIPSWQILTAHAQPFRGARDLAFCLKVPHDSLLVWASSGGSGETAQMRRLAWTFAARIGDKYQIRLMRPRCHCLHIPRKFKFIIYVYMHKILKRYFILRRKK